MNLKKFFNMISKSKYIPIKFEVSDTNLINSYKIQKGIIKQNKCK